MTTYTIYVNGNALWTTESWNTAIEIAATAAKNTIAQVWIEDSNGKTYN